MARDASGRPVPKQYWCPGGGPTLLRLALRRAARVASPDRIVVVVARDHEAWWSRDLSDLPPRRVVVQPWNRGTAPGILLPLLRILSEDPDATVAVFPADHHVAREERLAEAALAAAAAAVADPTRVVLLGIVPDAPEPGYGWIVPLAAGGGAPIRRVERFVEKPPVAEAIALRASGALWNSFVFVGRAATLASWILAEAPEWEPLAEVAGLGPEVPPGILGAIYDLLPNRDFSKDVLERHAADLAVARVPECGWTDLGTPDRVARHLGARGDPSPLRRRVASAAAAL